ncbi:MAG: Type 1 glutamine amidotransferase-like domain-containing protein [Nocardioidaceae bacterium]
MRPRQIFGFSGIMPMPSDDLGNVHLVDHALSLSGSSAPKVCYVPTAVGDARIAIETQEREFARRRPEIEFSVLSLFTQPSVADPRKHLLDQDVVLVEGGSVVNLLAVWRAHGLDEAFREAWEAGVVLAGPSAGSLCWHLGGPTDSFRDGLDPCTDGLGYLPYSNGVHDDFVDQPRRAAYREMIARGTLPAGYASEGGVGLHYIGTELAEAVTIRRDARAWWVESDGVGGYAERAIHPRYLG